MCPIIVSDVGRMTYGSGSGLAGRKTLILEYAKLEAVG
jgi:hypothetical protein